MIKDKSKLETFHEYVINDYNDSITVENVIRVVAVEKSDGSFTQIGIRPIIDEEIFVDSSNLAPELPGAGRIIAVGELDFLIKTLVNNKEIGKVFLEKKELEKFPKYIESNDVIILLSTKFYIDTFTKLMHRIDYEEKYPRLDRIHRIISVPQKVLENRIIIIDKEAVLWEKKLFDNEITGKKEKIDINIDPRTDGKVAITIRSVNKIKYIDPDLIKILEVKE